MTDERPIGAREAARRRVSGALASSARSLVAENGYDGTTIEMIADRAGVSRRTFFRHFETKDAVLLHYFDDLGARIAEAVMEAPSHMPPATALAEAFRVIEEFIAEPAERASQTQLAQIIAESPRLNAARNDRRRRNLEIASRALVAREAALGRELSPAVATAICGADFACLYATERIYLADMTRNPEEIFIEIWAGLFGQMTASAEYLAAMTTEERAAS